MKVSLSTKGYYGWKDVSSGKSASVKGEVWVDIPEDLDKIAEKVKNYSTTFVTPKGKKEYKGLLALAMRGFYNGLETVRGKARTLQVEEDIIATLEMLQTWADEAEPYSGSRKGFSPPKAEKSKLEEYKDNPAKMEEYLKSIGVKIS